MTNKELIEQNNRILIAIVDYLILKQSFENEFSKWQQEAQRQNELGEEVSAPPQIVHDAFNRVGEAEMNMIDAAGLLEKYYVPNTDRPH